MRKFSTLTGFILLIVSHTAAADLFGMEDDSYAGIQIAIPLETKHPGLALEKAEYTALFINQRDGFSEGASLSFSPEGTHIGYLKPSQSFDLGVSDLERHSIRLDLNADLSATHISSDTAAGIILLTALVVAFFRVVDEVADEIADCVTDDDDDCHDDDDAEEADRLVITEKPASGS